MKRSNHRNIGYGIGIFSLMSCTVPKVTELKKAQTMPDIVTTENTAETDYFQQINLKNYFTDSHLLELFDQVVHANPDFRIAQQRVDIANSFLQRSKMDLLPSLEIGASVSGDRYGKYTMEGVGNYDTNLSPNITEDQKINRDFTPNYWLGARSSWEIDAWGKLKNKKLAAQKKYLASEEGLRLLQVELFTDIANLYYQLVALDNRLAIYQKNYHLQQRAFEIVLAQREVGKATELAVQQFKAQNNNWLAEIEHIKVEIVTVEQAMTTLTGSYGGEVKRGKLLMPTNMEVLNKMINVEAVIHSRPDVAANYYVLEASQADAKAARAAFYPKIDLGASFGLNAFSAGNFFSPASLAGQLLGGLMVPVFNKGQLKHEFKVAGKEQEIAFLNYQKSVTTAFNELQSILKQTKIYERMLQLKSGEVDFLDRGVEVSNDLYLTGYANYFELINSQKSKLTAELDLLRFQHQNTRNNVLLFKALGGKLD
ncbi:efflux transporter outer membrane subunit [Chryseobacterium carnipullorum]|uniref:Efflux transporter outer membrane subunit n=1 Tax=Chryseobacterium carnipullorum TaxID=1124835 RepID=A0A1M7HBI8_CHRCU|nr:efflux transporter outer membrane subunit [Chryseobacterium carnipullorum]MDN5395162.1 efflux transporter outer membrane subunit [Chryseobacterium sp.]AZA51476.1 efflux transporter outer membrane subunit [Chryseobacterium carnipullorum]AZA67792.1 efflux transporter outer membrane subunit [Chryseobacterium carnipullorum]MDN5421991.1 efflux transporter outer membrane subunit [Chryseobacterium sp.]MDN5477627.1 efflux transporter outer membrane subunit [Chryseobacterium sp.]